MTAIRRTVRLFVPIISANTEREEEGYVFREWREAVDRSRSIMGRRFIVPVVVDDGLRGRPESVPSRFQMPSGTSTLVARRPVTRMTRLRRDADRRNPCYAAPGRGVTAATATTQLDRENPWPGLDSFEENARAFFHGRDREAEELLDHVLDAPVTVLYGRSGLGKTSLLRAGLFPLLRERHFLPVYVRFELKPGAAPLSRQLHQSVHDSIRADAPDAMLPSDEESLWEYLHRADFELWSARNYPLTPVIVLDQFEELFTLGERVPDLVREFRNDLGDLAENRIPADLAARIDDDEAVAERFHLRSHNYKLLISLREDFLPASRRMAPTYSRAGTLADAAASLAGRRRT